MQIWVTSILIGSMGLVSSAAIRSFGNEARAEAVPSPTAASVIASPVASPTASPAPTVGADGSPVAGVPTATPTPGLTAAEKKTLLSEYNRAQANEEKALLHLRRSQMRELKAAQSQRVRRWNQEQKKARREFFAAHQSGPERRKYVQDYIQRKKDFDQSVKIEHDTVKKSWAEKISQLKARQKEQRKKFKALVNQGQRPGSEFWPSGQ